MGSAGKIAVNVKDLAFYNDKTQSWDVEAGEFIISNAASAGDVKSSVKILIR